MQKIYENNPYIFIAAFLVLIALLIVLRIILKANSKKPDVLIGNSQIIGKRDRQEDSFSTVSDKKGTMAVLADGIGGYANGKMASSVAVKIFQEAFSGTDNIMPVEDFLVEVSRLSNREILELSKGMRTGTTLVSVIISNGVLYWASVGDSAIVLFRNGEIINLNRKHIFEAILQEQYESGRISRSEVLKNTMKKRITNYIGHEGFREIELSEEPIKLRRKDKIILCSDGVYNSLSEVELERVLSKNLNPHRTAEEIINIIERKNNPKQDNATIVVLQKK